MRVRTFNRPIAVTIAVYLSAGAAFAHVSFGAIDADGDDAISAAEFWASFGGDTSGFSQLASNSDGIVTLDEVRRSVTPKGERLRPHMARVADGTTPGGSSRFEGNNRGGNGGGNRGGNGGGKR